MLNKYKNIDIKICGNKNKLKLDYITSKEISIPALISLDDCQSSNQSISSIATNIKVIHSNILITPISFKAIDGKKTDGCGYKMSVSGIINEIIMFENLNNNMKTFSTTIPFCTCIDIPNDIDISKKIDVDAYIEDVNIFYINNEDIFQSTYVVMCIH